MIERVFKVYPNMLATLQEKDTKMTIKQRRRGVFGLSKDLEHLKQDSVQLFDAKIAKTIHNTVECNV